MRVNQLKSIHNWIRNTNTSEILFVSALIMPAYLSLYNYVINQIKPEWKESILGIAIIIYIIGVIWMKNSQSREEQNKKDLLVIKNNILDKGFQFMSFEKIKEIDKKYTEDKIRELIFIYPNELRLAKLKKDKKGIKILNIEEEEM